MEVTGTRLPEGIIEAKLGNLSVRLRESDGWVDATHLAQSAGKPNLSRTGHVSKV